MANQGYTGAFTDDKKLQGLAEYTIIPNISSMTAQLNIDLYLVTKLTVNIESTTHTVLIDGSPFYINSAIVGTGKIFIGKIEKTLHYNPDGSCASFDLGFAISLNTKIAGNNYTTIVEKGKYHTPDPIPAPAQISFNKKIYTFGEFMTIYISSPFKDKYSFDLDYVFFENSGNILTSYRGQNGGWNIPKSLAEQIPNSTSGTCSIICTTYDEDGEKLGTSLGTVNLSVNESFVPIVDFTAHYIVGSKQYDIGIGDIGYWNIEGNAKGQYNTTISKIDMSVNGNKCRVWTNENVDKSLSFTNYEGVTSLINKNTPIIVTATDARGLSATKSLNVESLDYNKARYDALSVVRCNSDGTLNDEGNNAIVKIKGAISPVFDNAYLITIRYKKTKDGDYDWTTIDIKGETGVGDIDISKVINGIDAVDSYNFQIIITDTIRNLNIDRIIVNKILDSNNVDIDFYGKGTGIAFGGPAKIAGIADFYLPIRAQKGFEALEFTSNNLNNFIDQGIYATGKNISSGNLKNSPNDNVGQDILKVDLSNVEKTSTGNTVLEKIIHQTFIKIPENTSVSSRTPTGVEVYFRTGYFKKSSNSTTWSSWRALIKSGNRILWKDAYYMNAEQTAILSEKISAQPHGIVIIFSRYDVDNKEALNYNWQHFFIHKDFVPLYSSGHTFHLCGSCFSVMGTKYLYIRDDRIDGHTDNTKNGTINGITYANNKFVLRFVIGV